MSLSVNCKFTISTFSLEKTGGPILKKFRISLIQIDTIHLFIFHISPNPSKLGLLTYKRYMVTVLIQCSTLCCFFHLHSVGTESFPSLSVFNNTIWLLPLIAFALESRGVRCQRCPHIRQEIAECTRYFFVGVASTIVRFKVIRPLLQ